MGKVTFDGGASGNKFAVRETTSGEVEIANETTATVLFEADPTSIRDAGGVQLSSHGSRHGFTNATDKMTISFGTESTANVGAGATSTISAGAYIARCGTNTSVEYSPDGGTTWYTLIAAGGTGVIFSDGSNVRFNNGGGAAEDSYLLPIS